MAKMWVSPSYCCRLVEPLLPLQSLVNNAARFSTELSSPRDCAKPKVGPPEPKSDSFVRYAYLSLAVSKCLLALSFPTRSRRILIWRSLLLLIMLQARCGRCSSRGIVMKRRAHSIRREITDREAAEDRSSRLRQLLRTFPTCADAEMRATVQV